MVLFGWGFLFWVKSPLRYGVLKPVPNNETVVGVLQKNLPESGVYRSPFADESVSREERETADKARSASALEIQSRQRRAG